MSSRGFRGRIRPPRRGLVTDYVDFDDIWEVLSQSLREIHMRNASKLSFEELYRNAYKLVLKKHGEKLYQNVKQLVGQHLQDVAVREVEPLLFSAVVSGHASSFGTATLEKRMGGERFLGQLKAVWEDHRLCMGMITDVLMYMDRVYCTDNKVPSIHATGMGLFRDHILRNPQYNIGKVLNTVILDQIQMERDGDIIDHATIRSCIYMLEGLYETEDEIESGKIYLTSFEPEFLETSTSFYHREGERLLRECDAATYLRKVDKRLNEEYSRCQDTLSTLTKLKIKDVVERELILRNIKEVLEMEGSGLRAMLENDRLEELKLVYKLISRVDMEKKVLKAMIRDRLIELGDEISRSVANPHAPLAQPAPAPTEGAEGQSAKPKTGPSEDKAANNATILAIRWVDDVLALKDKYDRIWEASFESDKGTQVAITKAFTTFINDFQRSPEYMSLFIDENLKRGLKGKSEIEVDEVLDKAITLFRYVGDKDVFERYYKKHLSRRLLNNRSVSQDAEKQMIGKLKMEVGHAFTAKLEHMFKDMNLSEEMTTEYKRAIQDKEDEDSEMAKKIDLTMNVLTSTLWPIQWNAEGEGNGHTCTYPKEVEAVRKAFTSYYLERHSGRRLDWLANMGTADLKTSFKGRTHELNVSTYAMVILLAFNDVEPGESLSFEELRTITSIPDSELARQLQSLSVPPKTRVLLKKPMSKDVKPTDRFSFNDNFESKFRRLRIGVITGNRAENEKERKETTEKVDETRAAQIEAAIVRIMKQRKRLEHADLMLEVMEQLKSRFRPDPVMIKKRIESLMEREYIERAEGQRQTYVYLA